MCLGYVFDLRIFYGRLEKYEPFADVAGSVSLHCYLEWLPYELQDGFALGSVPALPPSAELNVGGFDLKQSEEVPVARAAVQPKHVPARLYLATKLCFPLLLFVLGMMHLTHKISKALCEHLQLFEALSVQCCRRLWLYYAISTAERYSLLHGSCRPQVQTCG